MLSESMDCHCCGMGSLSFWLVRALMGKPGKEAFALTEEPLDEEEDASADKPKKPVKTKAEQAAVMRKAYKATQAVALLSVAPPEPQQQSTAAVDITKAERAHRDLKQWKLMDVNVHVEDLNITLSMQDEVRL
jgi:hypothetical protein